MICLFTKCLMYDIIHYLTSNQIMIYNKYTIRYLIWIIHIICIRLRLMTEEILKQIISKYTKFIKITEISVTLYPC